MRSARKILAWTAMLSNFAASSGYSACIATSESLLRAQFIRCENASFYLEASGAYEIYARAHEEALARIDPRRHDEYLERTSGLFPPEGYEARVLVVSVDWRVEIDPWLPGISPSIEVQGQAQEVRDSLRYWWNGTVEACDALAEGEPIDLRVRPDCCDTIPGSPACIVRLNLAEPAQPEMSEVLSAAIAERQGD